MAEPTTAAPVREARWRLGSGPGTPGRARVLAGDALTAWGLSAIAWEVVLLVDELVANAVTHGRGPIELHLRVQDGSGLLWCAVTDASRVPPRRRSVGVDAEDGRGLALVEALAVEHGWYWLPRGKAVWFSAAFRP